MYLQKAAQYSWPDQLIYRHAHNNIIKCSDWIGGGGNYDGPINQPTIQQAYHPTDRPTNRQTPGS